MFYRYYQVVLAGRIHVYDTWYIDDVNFSFQIQLQANTNNHHDLLSLAHISLLLTDAVHVIDAFIVDALNSSKQAIWSSSQTRVAYRCYVTIVARAKEDA